MSKKKKNNVSNSALATLVVAALLVSVVGVFLAVSRAPSIPVTGQQTGTDTGTAQFILQQVASITFANDTVNFGTGFVNTSGGNLDCRLDTNQTSIDTSKCVNFTVPAISNYFVLENDGTVNVTVELLSNVTAVQFVGGINPGFQWRIINNETGSCTNITQPAFKTVNTTGPNGEVICNNLGANSGGLGFSDDADSMRIDINITIPTDANQGIKQAEITATATSIL